MKSAPAVAINVRKDTEYMQLCIQVLTGPGLDVVLTAVAPAPMAGLVECLCTVDIAELPEDVHDDDMVPLGTGIVSAFVGSGPEFWRLADARLSDGKSLVHNRLLHTGLFEPCISSICLMPSLRW